MMSQLQHAEPRTLLTHTQRMMATDVSVTLATEPERAEEAQAALDACFAWFAEVETRLSRFQPESELSALNRAAGTWFIASETLYTAVALAVAAARASDGLFNPTLLRALEMAGYDRDFSLLAQDATAARVSAPPRGEPLDAWRAIVLDETRRAIRLPVGAALDLSGIAKGWAADVALEGYCQPFAGALINVGGDLRLRGGPQPGQPWRIGIRDPRETETPSGEVWNRAELRFSRGALATSGAARRWWSNDGARYHHLLDPHTGQPLPLWTGADAGADVDALGREPLVASVTALAPTGARAEIATKVALARGCGDALAAVERAWARWGAVGPHDDCDVGVALIFTLSDGRVIHSAHLATWLSAWGTDTAPLPMLLNSPGASPLALGAIG